MNGNGGGGGGGSGGWDMATAAAAAAAAFQQWGASQQPQASSRRESESFCKGYSSCSSPVTCWLNPSRVKSCGASLNRLGVGKPFST